MQALRFFLDTHDAGNGTFPAGLTPDQFAAFYPGYEQACYQAGVVPVQVHVGYDAGRAFCLTMAVDAEAVLEAHRLAGLPCGEIVEVRLASPGSAFPSLPPLAAS